MDNYNEGPDTRRFVSQVVQEIQINDTCCRHLYRLFLVSIYASAVQNSRLPLYKNACPGLVGNGKGVHARVCAINSTTITQTAI